MIWIIINWVLAFIGCGLIGYAYHVNSSRNYKALTPFIFGVIFLVVAAVSGFIAWKVL